MTRYFGKPGDSFAAYQIAKRHYSHIGHINEIQKTFEFLQGLGLSDGIEINTNVSKEAYDINLADRSFIRGQIGEDLRLHDLLMSD